MKKMYINPKKRLGRINPELQGHFSEHLGRCIYEGIYVGEKSSIPNVNGMRTDVVEALKKINVPVLRWPGGCFADEYHWMDGIGEKQSRKKMINTHWGGVIEDNSFGTHEYMELCEQLGCRTYVNGNLGSGTVREMSEWAEYMTFEGVSPMADLRKANGHEKAWKVDYFGVGNESWGCGGNMNPEHYGNEYRRYQTFVRNYDPGRPIEKIACGPNADDYEWTDIMLKTAFRKAEQFHGFMNGLSLHYYTVPGTWENKGTACDFDTDTYFETLKKTMFMEELIRRHTAIMDKYDKKHEVGLVIDEWGTWYDVEPGTNPGFLYQQNTIRDALVAGINLNIFNSHCDRVKMANIAQMVNVLQAVILTDGERMITTPTYHVFDLYKCHQGAELIDSFVETEQVGTGDNYVPDITQSVSVSEDGTINITLTSQRVDSDTEMKIKIADMDISSVEVNVVGGEIHEHNTFDDPERVCVRAYDGFNVTADGIELNMPASSVVCLRVR